MAAQVALTVAQRYLSRGIVFFTRRWDRITAAPREHGHKPRLAHVRRDRTVAPAVAASLSPAEANRHYLDRRLAAQPREMLLCLYYDAEGGFLGQQCAVGTPSRVMAERTGLIEAAARLAPRYVLLAHNHPGGEARPSAADVEATRALHRLFAALGMILVDHVILAADMPPFSFLASGLM